MARSSLWALLVIGALSVLMFGLNVLALKHHLYYTYWWYDVMMHFLGGLIIGGATAWASRRLVTVPHSGGMLCIAATLATLLVGGVWEALERSSGMFVGHGNIALDTVKDLGMGVIGALVACGVALLISYTRHERSH